MGSSFLSNLLRARVVELVRQLVGDPAENSRELVGRLTRLPPLRECITYELGELRRKVASALAGVVI